MKIIQKETATEPERAVDWTKPLVVFDPWPFDLAGVTLDSTAVWFLNVDGVWHEPDQWVLQKCEDNILGVTTLGETFVTSQEALDSLS